MPCLACEHVSGIDAATPGVWEKVVHKNPVFSVAALGLGLALGCVGLHAQNFMPANAMSGGSDRAIADSASPARPSSLVLDESSPTAVDDATVAKTRRLAMQPNHVGVDDASHEGTLGAASTVTTAAAGAITTSTATPAAGAGAGAIPETETHKPHGGLHWQSLLPGVMK
jgi:hypothetical protein